MAVGVLLLLMAIAVDPVGTFVVVCALVVIALAGTYWCERQRHRRIQQAVAKARLSYILDKEKRSLTSSSKFRR